MFGAIAGGIASALAGGAMSKLFGGGQKAASGGIQGDVLATDNNTVGMGDAGIKSANTLLNVTLIILTLSVSRLLNLLLRLVAFLLFLNPQCLASISRWITASSSWKRFCLFVCRALSSI